MAWRVCTSRPVERDRDDRQGDRTDRQVHVEDPAPRQVVDEEPAEQRPDDGRDAEHPAEVALIPPPLARRDDVADHRERHDHQAARAEALQGAKRDQLRHRLREAAEHGSDQEDDDRRLQHLLAPVEVAELPVERAGDRGERAGTRSRPTRGARCRRGRRRSWAAPSRRSSGRGRPAAARRGAR